MSRFARVPTPEIEARLGTAFGRLVNVSATGALVRTSAPCSPGSQCPLILNLPTSPITVTVRVVRANPTTPTHRQKTESLQYLVGVAFTEFSSTARHAIETLCGTSFGQRE